MRAGAPKAGRAQGTDLVPEIDEISLEIDLEDRVHGTLEIGAHHDTMVDPRATTIGIDATTADLRAEMIAIMRPLTTAGHHAVRHHASLSADLLFIVGRKER